MENQVDKNQKDYRVRRFVKSLFLRSNRWFWQIPIVVTVACLVQWLLFARSSALTHATAHFFNRLPLPSDAWLFTLLLPLLVACVAYLYIDYRQHIAPLQKEFPEIAYAPLHHMRVVVLPRMKYNWKRGVCGIVYGIASFIVLTSVLSTMLNPSSVRAYEPNEFVTTWKTDNEGETGNNQIKLPVSTESADPISIDWGDGHEGDELTHTYDEPGVYTVTVNGIDRFCTGCGGYGDAKKLLTVEQWGDTEWTDMRDAFRDASNLQINATDAPDLSNVTSLGGMFFGATSMNADISSWDVSNVTEMSGMFGFAEAFSQPLNEWDVSSVTNMYSMFNGAGSFNQNINDWDVSSVTDMGQMFVDASSFNQPLNDWDTSSVTNMYSMFNGAGSFNQNINDWDVSSVTDMGNMFGSASVFNEPMGDWNVSNVTNMYGMFNYAAAFNQPLDNWDVSSVTDMGPMFGNAWDFNQPLNDWDVSSVTDMGGMFSGAASFNQPLDNWDTSSVTDMGSMFWGAAAFDQNINSWDVSNVTYMIQMFSLAASFNQPLDNWDTSSVTDMGQMFMSAGSFDQSLASWDVSNVTNMNWMFGSVDSIIEGYFDGVPFEEWPEYYQNIYGLPPSYLSIPNYDATLTAWSNQSLQNDVIFDVGASTYCAATDERQAIIDDFGWTINDAGEDCTPDFTNAFITTWKTDNPGGSEDNQITIPVSYGGETYDYTVDWGDGNITSSHTGHTTHTYAAPGTYTVKITGDFPRIYFSGSGDAQKLLTVEQWGSIQWSSMEYAFHTASNLQINATDVPDLTNATSMYGMFADSTTFNSDISDWDVSTITNMGRMFRGSTSFNQPLNNWDVNSVVNMSRMFESATSFNQPLDGWDTGSVQNVEHMFRNASAFNQPLNNWDTSSIEYMSYMFAFASSFNQPLDNLNVSSVKEMEGTFLLATAFNQPLDNWNVSSVTDMNTTFTGASAFNQPLNNWDTSSVNNMIGMFAGASSFDQSLASWDISGVTNMSLMFIDEIMEPQPGFSINPSGLSTANYDATLISWSNQALQSGVTLNAGTSTYCAAVEERQDIIDNFGWTINDAGEDCTPDFTNAFITTWKTDNPGGPPNQITIPTTGGSYNYAVDWGDGNTTSGHTGDATHTYAAAGTYTVTVTGAFPRIYFNNSGDRQKILAVEQWGINQWSSMESAFNGAENLRINATDSPDLSNVTDASYMFTDATNLNDNINNWDVSTVENMSLMFAGTLFNQPLNNWDVSNVTSMNGMFSNATGFNQSLDSWNVSNVTNMTGMFYGAHSFNQPISSWNVGNVSSAAWMFAGATSFNQPLNTWNTSSLTTLAGTFQNATSFNQPLNTWNTSSVTDMKRMFAGATAFDQSLSSWNIVSATAMDSMFLSEPEDMSGTLMQPSGLSTANYDATLIAWSNRLLQNGVTFGGGLSTYCAAAEERQDIIDNFGWTITDGGEDCSELQNIQITTTDLPNAAEGRYYSAYIYTANAQNGQADFSIIAGSIPDGLLFESIGDYARISGTPTQAGDFSITVEAHDTVGSDTQVLTLTVQAPPEVPANSPLVTINSPGNNVTLPEGPLVITGTGPADKIIEIYLNGVHKGGVRAGSNSQWTYTIPHVPGGQYEIEAKWEPAPQSIAVVPVINLEHNPFAYTELKIIDTTDDTYIGSKYVEGAVSQSIMSPDGTKIYVINGFYDTPKIYEIDLQNNTTRLLAAISDGGVLFMTMTLDSAGKKIYINGQTSKVRILTIDALSLETVDLPPGIVEVNSEVGVLSADESELYIPSLAAPSTDPLDLYIDILNTEDYTVDRVFAGQIPITNNFALVSMIRIGDLLYINAGSGKITIFNTTTRSLERIVDLGVEVDNDEGWIGGLSYNPYNNKLYMFHAGNSGLISLDLGDDSVEVYGLPPNGGTAFNVHKSDDGLKMYIPWTKGGSPTETGLSVFDVNAGEYIETEGYPVYSQQGVTYGLGNGSFIGSMAPSEAAVSVVVSGGGGVNPQQPENPQNPSTPSTPGNPGTNNPGNDPGNGGGSGSGVVQEEPTDTPARSGKPYNQPRHQTEERLNGLERGITALAKFFNVSPQALAWVFPWLLIILLALLAFVSGIRALWLLFVVAKTRKLVDRQELLNHEKRSLLSLSGHYLRTPLTILSAGLEMLPQGSVARQKITASAGGLRATVERLTQSIESNHDLMHLSEPEPRVHQSTTLLQKAVVIPVALIVLLVIGINLVVMFYTSINPGWINIAAQVAGVVLAASVLQAAYKSWRERRGLVEYEHQLLSYEQTLDSSRNQFIKGVADELVPAVVAVDTAIPPGLPEDANKYFKEGLRQLEHTIESFILISQLEQKKLQQRAEQLAVRETFNRAKDELQSSTGISMHVPKETVVTQPEFLLRKVFGSLIDNAAAHTDPHQPIEVSSHGMRNMLGMNIVDHGEGIPPEKLSLLFKPLSRIEEVEDFTHQGMGLSLYVNRLIMHYLGGEISAESQVGKGTKMKLLIPKRLTV